MKSTTAGLCLAIASLAILNLTPCQAQTSAETSTTTTTTTAAPAAAATTTTTKRHHFRKQRAKRAKRVKVRKHRLSGRNLSGGVSKKGKHGKTYKPYSSAQQKRLDKLDSALSNPKQYKKIPELSTPGTMSPSQSAPGL
jgi:hypothetical protein